MTDASEMVPYVLHSSLAIILLDLSFLLLIYDYPSVYL